MNKIELIETLQENANLRKPDAAQVVKIFFDSMADSLIRGERVEIRGLCSFYIRKYETYMGRNPKTGQKVTVQPKKLPFFKCGKDLKDRVNYQKPDLS